VVNPTPDAEAATSASRRGPTWLQAAVLGVALAFLGAAIGYLVAGRQGVPDEDSVDVGFYQDMISHHEQALQMAAVQLASGSDPTVSSFAREILQFQSYEIGLMRQQLAEWGVDPFERPDTAMGWMGQSMPVEEMPGLATEEQMQELRDSSGSETDALFLELMAAHHLGGVAMAQQAMNNAEESSVRELASTMARNQAIEVNEFREIADRLGLDADIP
jgi:uncharacterized protein (DUF305 family)